MNSRPVSVPSVVAVLEPYASAGVFGPTEIHLSATFARLAPRERPDVMLALAAAARGPSLGHVCIRLEDVSRLAVDQDGGPVAELPWPDAGSWAEALAASTVVATPEEARDDPLRPLVWDGMRLYLQRYWCYEDDAAGALASRSVGAGLPWLAGATRLGGTLDEVFGPADPSLPDLQRRAAHLALTSGLSIISGGPGTGKTRTIARLLAAAQQIAVELGHPLQVALAAPTGKAAARMTEALRSEVLALETERVVSDEAAAAVRATDATTLHSLLGASGDRFRHGRSNPLPHDLVVVDETSMVSLPLLARLLDAVRPDSPLLLAGDPFQLASVEAGTVMADIVGPAAGTVDVNSSGPLSDRVTVLRRVHRFAAGSAIAALSDAVRDGDVDRALGVLDSDDPQVEWVRDGDAAAVAAVEERVLQDAARVVAAARAGDAPAGLAAATHLKVLTATRHRAFGLHYWTARIEAGLRSAVSGFDGGPRWYIGRPIMVTANDHLIRVVNGDVGLIVRHDGAGEVAMAGSEGIRWLPTSRLDRFETWWAMTIHKSQGSEFPEVVVSLPPLASRVLTRELLYTAVTRAKDRVTIIASVESLRTAIERRISRASGLADRLWGTAHDEGGLHGG